MTKHILFIVFITILSFNNCRTEKEQNGNALLANIIINQVSNSTYSSLRSVIEMERIDSTSFKGKCIDTFISITAYQFYVSNLAFLSGSLDTPTRRTATTTKQCIDLGFRDPGGFVVNSTGGVSFTVYECSAKNTACSTSTLNTQLGSSNTNPKGSYGSYSF